MKEIIKYVADDGTEFTSKEKCLKHDELCFEISKIVDLLPKTPKNDGCRFANGAGYIQHKSGNFLIVREQLLRIGNRIYPHHWFVESIENIDVDPSYCGRLIDETCRPLANAWHRIMCTDKKFREWGQPYFVNHPEEAEQKCLNEETKNAS